MIIVSKATKRHCAGTVQSQGRRARNVEESKWSTDHFIANFLETVPVKEFWKLVNIWQSYQLNLATYFYDSWFTTETYCQTVYMQTMTI